MGITFKKIKNSNKEIKMSNLIGITSSNTVSQENLNNNNNRGPNSVIEYISELGCRIDHRHLQRKFKHASDFGVLGKKTIIKKIVYCLETKL